MPAQGRHLPLERLALLLKSREHPLLEAAHVDFHPVRAPVDRLRVPGKLLAVRRREPRPQLPRVLALEDEALAGDEGQEQLPGHLQHRELPVDALQRLVRAREQGGRAWRAPRSPPIRDQLPQSLGGGAAFPPGSCAIRHTGHRYTEERVSRTSPTRPLTASGDATTSLRLKDRLRRRPPWSVAGGVISTATIRIK